MSNLVVNQCEFGCGIVGHWDVTHQEGIGEQDMEEHYKTCPHNPENKEKYVKNKDKESK